MIIRSGLIRNRDDVRFDEFTDHWERIHGPLARKVPGMLGYSQNHIKDRILEEDSLLHRIDGISQLYFDDIEGMKTAMASDEQHACVEDIRSFLSEVTILIQQAGERHSLGAAGTECEKLIYLLVGSPAAWADVEKALSERLQSSTGCAYRLNAIINREFSVDASVASGPQSIDAVLEVWLPEFELDRFCR